MTTHIKPIAELIKQKPKIQKFEISIIKNSHREMATIEYSRSLSTMSITFADGRQKTYNEVDIYFCFAALRKEFTNIRFLCKGSKINVYPSAMSSHMSSGVVAYEVNIGNPDAELVHIFDYEENELTNDINKQISHRKTWTKSF